MAPQNDGYGYEMGLRDHITNSDEKVVLARAIGGIIRENNIASALDIGAGEGTFASMIAAQVRRYVAVEKRPQNAKMLRELGLQVIEQNFPTPIEGTFDIVLASHSIPTDKMRLEDFVDHMVAAATDQGTVCIVTHKREKDAWYEFMSDIMGENWNRKDYDIYEMAIDVLKHYGAVRVEKVDTHVLARTPRELFNALRFTYAGKEPSLVDLFNAKRSEALAWLGSRFEKGADGMYRFPFTQYIIVLRKDAHSTPARDRRSDI